MTIQISTSRSIAIVFGTQSRKNVAMLHHPKIHLPMKTTLLAFSLAILASCGGGGSSPSAPPAGQQPNPSPSTPTSSVVAVGSVPSKITYEVNGSFNGGTANTTKTDLDGDFIRGPANASSRMLALGVDKATGLVFGTIIAPAGATVLSPLSTVIAAHGNADTVVAALGLTTGPNALQAGRDVLNFNPVEAANNRDRLIANDAARLRSINVQLLALAAIGTDTSGDPEDAGVVLSPASNYLAKTIQRTGSASLTDQRVISDFLAQTQNSEAVRRYGNVVPEMLVEYFSTVPDRISTDEEAKAWVYAFRFSVLPDFKHLTSFSPNPAIESIAAVTSDDLINVVSYFRTSPVPQIMDYVAVPNYYELTDVSNGGVNKGGFTGDPYSLESRDCQTQQYLPYCNNFLLFSGNDQKGTVEAISDVPQDKIRVILDSNGYVFVTRAGEYTRLTSFRYSTRSSEGILSEGIAFVRVRPRYP